MGRPVGCTGQKWPDGDEPLSVFRSKQRKTDKKTGPFRSACWRQGRRQGDQQGPGPPQHANNFFIPMQNLDWCAIAAGVSARARTHSVLLLLSLTPRCCWFDYFARASLDLSTKEVCDTVSLQCPDTVCVHYFY